MYYFSSSCTFSCTCTTSVFMVLADKSIKSVGEVAEKVGIFQDLRKPSVEKLPRRFVEAIKVKEVENRLA